MPKPSNTEETYIPPIPKAPTWTLDDWCTHRSATLGRAVECLSGFHFRMQRSGENHLTNDEWESRFQAFLSAPAGRG